MTSIFQIVYIADPVSITRKDGTTCLKQSIILREFSGKFADQYVATYFCDKPLTVANGSTVAASLRFSTRTYEGQDFQDITLQEFSVLSLPPAPHLPSLTSTSLI